MNPEVIAALAFFGLIFVLPIVFMLQKHQRAMAELMHRAGADELQHRIAALEHEVRNLRSSQHELTIRMDDQKGLGPGDS